VGGMSEVEDGEGRGPKVGVLTGRCGGGCGDALGGSPPKARNESRPQGRISLTAEG